MFIYLKMKNRKKIGRKSGGMILAYKESLENYIELLDVNIRVTNLISTTSI
jgi:tRNA-binding EMAP/Myf-like protein